MRTTLLVNPASGHRKAVGIGAEAAELLIEAGHQVQTIIGSDAQDAETQLAAAIDHGLDNIIVVGGDGGTHGILDQIAHTDITLGLIPAGTGNDTARALNLPMKDVKAAVGVIARGRTKQIDLARAGDSYVTTVVASGFDSKVSERANAMRWPRGNIRYNIALVAELRVFKPLPFAIELDGEILETGAMLVAVGNGPSFGGGMRICEGAELDDGLLDIVIIKPISKVELIKVFPKVYKGTHVSHPAVVQCRARRVKLSSPGIVAYGDGERLGPLPLDIEADPGALRVFVP